MLYRSKQDWWLAAILFSGIVVCLGVGGVMLFLYFWSMLVGIALIAVGLLQLWCLGGTQYDLDEVQMTIWAGPFRWTVPTRSIRKVTPTRNPLSSPALSLDRLRIDYEVAGKSRSIMISPVDREAFLAEVAELVPSAELPADQPETSAV